MMTTVAVAEPRSRIILAEISKSGASQSRLFGFGTVGETHCVSPRAEYGRSHPTSKCRLSRY